MVESFVPKPEVSQCTLDIGVENFITKAIISMTTTWSRILSNKILRYPYTMGQSNCLNAKSTTETTIPLPLMSWASREYI